MLSGATTTAASPGAGGAQVFGELAQVHQRVLTARLRVGEVAVAFREQVAAGDLARAWPLTDPRLRMAWAQAWAQDHYGRWRWLCVRRLAFRLACLDGPDHPLFQHFADDRIHQLRQVEATGWRHPGAGLAPLSADTEALYARPENPDAWGAPGRSRRHTDADALERYRLEGPRLRIPPLPRPPTVRPAVRDLGVGAALTMTI